MCFIQTIRRLLEDLSTWSYLTAKDVVEDGCIVVEHVDIDSMLANPLTKGLNPVVFKWGVENMGIVRFFNIMFFFSFSFDILCVLITLIQYDFVYQLFLDLYITYTKFYKFLFLVSISFGFKTIG